MLLLVGLLPVARVRHEYRLKGADGVALSVVHAETLVDMQLYGIRVRHAA